jgi:hypothetical protein
VFRELAQNREQTIQQREYAKEKKSRAFERAKKNAKPAVLFTTKGTEGKREDKSPAVS